MLGTVLAIRHIHFEDLGTFEPVLRDAGYAIRYHDVGDGGLAALDPLQPDLLAVLGGPVGVHDGDAYPFLAEERALIARRLEAGKPLLGICLGAQQIAMALGGAVAPGSEKEIGFSPLALTEAGQDSPLRHLDGVPVLHWHGDGFRTPRGAATLASTPACPNQAFALGDTVLALQFHPEADACNGLERWLVGHACELAASGTDPQAIRADAARFGPGLREAARAMFADWIEGFAP